MTSFDQKLQDWIVQELNIVFDGRLKTVPDVATISQLNAGKNKKVWNYVIQHVRSRQAAEKIRRILKVKHTESVKDESNLSDFRKDPNVLHQKITVTNEKCMFLKSSLSNLKDKILAIESTIRELRNEVDKINQRTAFLEMQTLKYKDKTLTLNSLQNQLSFILCNRFPAENVCNIPYGVVLNDRKDKDSNGLDFLLSQVLSLVVKKLSDSKDFEHSKEVVKKRIDQKLNTVSLRELLYHLKDSSKVSCRIVLKNAATALGPEDCDKQNQTLSQKQLQDLKLSHIQSVFNVTKVKKEMENLIKMKDSLIESKIKSMVNSENEEFPTKQKLFKLMLENKALSASITYFEGTLCKIQKDNHIMQEKNKQHMLTIPDVESVMKKFYKDFDLLWNLLNLVPGTCQEIIKFVSFLHSYTNEQVFVLVTPDLRDYSLKLQNDLKLRMELFWCKCDHKSLICPSMCDPLHESDVVWGAANLPRFYNLGMIPHKIKYVKEMLKEHEGGKFEIKSDNATTSEERFNNMMNACLEIQMQLKLGERQLECCPELTNKLNVAVTDWWEQGAQYIHKISCEDKTLKMWQDILKVLSDYQ